MSRSAFRKLREFHAEEIRPYLAARDRKPLLTQLWEVAALYRRYRYPPYQYLRAALYLKTAPERIDTYMPSKLLWRLRESLNPAEARILARDKLRFRERMEAAGLPVLREVLSVDRVGLIRDAAGEVYEMDAAIARLQGGEFFVKPVEGRFGAGARLLLPGDDLKSFLATARNTIVQPRLRQHPLLESLYPHAVNTVRIDTLCIDGSWISNASVLRLGMGGSIVDNGSSGGLTVGIDLETGALRPFGRQKPKFSTRAYDRHPDTGVIFKNFVVPHWNLVRRTILRAAESMLPLQTIGWDVVITETGVVLLEANDSWGIYVLQSGWGGLADTPLGRMACEFHGLKAAPGIG